MDNTTLLIIIVLVLLLFGVLVRSRSLVLDHGKQKGRR